MNAETVVLGAREVARYLTIRECIDAIAETLRAHETGKSRGPASSGFTLPGGSFHAKLAAIEDDGRIFVAVKAQREPARQSNPAWATDHSGSAHYCSTAMTAGLWPS